LPKCSRSSSIIEENITNKFFLILKEMKGNYCQLLPSSAHQRRVSWKIMNTLKFWWWIPNSERKNRTIPITKDDGRRRLETFIKVTQCEKFSEIYVETFPTTK
jgi:hypothetical protein